MDSGFDKPSCRRSHGNVCNANDLKDLCIGPRKLIEHTVNTNSEEFCCGKLDLEDARSQSLSC
ncbi:hypothetical protein KIN20_024704 [Parelaphostrongylus tenuis]|uniref:Uncharacterized protein n=1 Tax=Parelaphostrongylus tenuis TaxID=148309 RepID=A0AAD5N8G4_PARTN|nr:hypothetical protein KIN20_024704 [Parelaphostrongylus tenuis]